MEAKHKTYTRTNKATGHDVWIAMTAIARLSTSYIVPGIIVLFHYLCCQHRPWKSSTATIRSEAGVSKHMVQLVVRPVVARLDEADDVRMTQMPDESGRSSSDLKGMDSKKE
jgi:hypothetical protein